jgi:predicted dinucleotide-binding enzyme
MNIGIVGTGAMGRALGLRWLQTGHAVLFGSRDPAKARRVAAEGRAASGDASRATAGDADAAAAFGDVVLYTARSVLPSRLLHDPRSLAGKIVLDCNNSAIYGLDGPPDPHGRPGLQFPSPVPSRAERRAADVPDAHVVKAFNTIPAQVIALPRERLVAHGVSVFLCGDDAAAKARARPLVEELGFAAVDGGELARAQLVEGLADLLRVQMIAMGLGPYATLSLHVLPEGT